ELEESRLKPARFADLARAIDDVIPQDYTETPAVLLAGDHAPEIEVASPQAAFAVRPAPLATPSPARAQSRPTQPASASMAPLPSFVAPPAAARTPSRPVHPAPIPVAPETGPITGTGVI